MNREDIRARVQAEGARLAKPVKFDCPGFGPVLLRLISAAQAEDNKRFFDTKEAAEVPSIAIACACCLCDESGALVYDPGNPVDLAEIAGMGTLTLGNIVREANRINGQSEKGADEAGNA